MMARFLDPPVNEHLLVDDGEYVVDEVPQHWVTIAGPVVGLTAVIPLFLSLPLWGRFWGVPLVAGLVLAGWSVGAIHRVHMDRFVITNLRVFRVHGVFDLRSETMSASRILDVAVVQPFAGRVLGYGHLVIRSGARDAGLRDIRFVPHPQRRDQLIHRVIQRAAARPTDTPGPPDAAS